MLNQQTLIKLFEPIIDIIVKSSYIKLHFITDYITSAFPFFSIFVDHDIIKKMIDEDRFELVVNPILYIREKRMSNAMQVDFVEYKEENLSFQGAEFHLISQKFQTARYTFESWVGKAVHNETVIHISSHGMPINMYTDPALANIRGEESGFISVPMIQAIASKSDYDLVCINCCYGGEFSNQNYFKKYCTAELIGYNTAFMLNGKAAVIAPKWQVKDIAVVFFTELLYQNILSGKDYSKSFIKAVKDLYCLDIEGCKKIVNKIFQKEIREKVLSKIEGCDVSYPFKNIVDVGVYNYFELL